MKNRLVKALGALAIAAIAAFFGLNPETLAPAKTARDNGATAQARSGSKADFDYYVLVLSWSPTFCEEKNDNRSAQCNGKRDFGFVVHGLWPQYESGYPEFCDTRARVEDRTVDRMLPLMPAKGLIYHQWKKHGTCSGMYPLEYFATVEEAYKSITIPEPLRKLDKTIVIRPSVIEDAFLEANPKLDPDEIVINCRSKRLREVKVCLTPDLEPRACGRDVHRECRDKSIRMPPVR